ncbi:GAS2-like protein 1 [Elysia marginata]|uniref:GAS2-like protein 1 n=1 Tax=Elysia marginata TaxID=1093978 RepID=A0AAV4IHN1_9GAST|nr:GAS2-like protein 1 [Elysia marginata]
MVRVGGGWDTLENYLNKHDPCQCNYRGHRAGTAQAAHKMQVNQSQQQRRASTPGGNSAHHMPSAGGGAGAAATNTPTSPRRMSTAAAPLRNRSVSPHNQQANQGTKGSANSSMASGTSSHSAKQNPPRSKSPTLIISRHTPSGGGGGASNKSRGGASVSNSMSSNAPASSNFSVSRVSSSQGTRGESVVSKSWSQPLVRPTSNSTTTNTNNNKNNNSIDSASTLSSQPIRCKSPSPGRLRSPSPLNALKPSQQTSASSNNTGSSSSSARAKGQGQRVVTPRRLPGSTMISDNEEDEIEDCPAGYNYYHHDEVADDYSDEIETREQALEDNADTLYPECPADNVSDSG